MATSVAMPKLGLTMQEGTVVRWLKAPGDAVAEHEPLCEIETDKITNEVAAPVTGVLLKILVSEGETVPCQTPLCLIGAAGETPAAAAASPAAAPAPAAGPAPVATPAPAAAPAPVATPAPAGGRVRISPAARKMARNAGIDYTRLVGTGPLGRIVMADVARALAAQAPVNPAAGAPAAAAPTAAPAGVSEPLTPMRRTIAQRMTASLREAAQLTLTTRVDAAALVAFRQLMVAQTEAALGFKIGYNELVVRAVALALAAHPEIAVAWSEGGILRRAGVHVGIAVDVPGGLLVPVLRDADRLGLAELHRQIAALAQRARDGKLISADMEGGVITVSNLGQYGIDAFTPILNPPESAILGVGAVRAVPVVRDGAVVPGHELTLSLTIDHRLIDGAPGAHFLAAVRDLLEHPARLAV